MDLIRIGRYLDYASGSRATQLETSVSVSARSSTHIYPRSVGQNSETTDAQVSISPALRVNTINIRMNSVSITDVLLSLDHRLST